MFTPLPEKFLLIERASAFSFMIVLLSQLAFLSFQKFSMFGMLKLVVSILTSALAFVFGSVVLAIMAQVVDGALLMFLTYVILSYGIFGMHVVSLTLLVD